MHTVQQLQETIYFNLSFCPEGNYFPEIYILGPIWAIKNVDEELGG